MYSVVLVRAALLASVDGCAFRFRYRKFSLGQFKTAFEHEPLIIDDLELHLAFLVRETPVDGSGGRRGIRRGARKRRRETRSFRYLTS